MLRQIKVTELCKELEEKLVGLQYSEDSLRRYRKVFREFEEYAGDCDYSQSRGTDFLLWKGHASYRSRCKPDFYKRLSWAH